MWLNMTVPVLTGSALEHSAIGSCSTDCSSTLAIDFADRATAYTRD